MDDRSIARAVEAKCLVGNKVEDDNGDDNDDGSCDDDEDFKGKDNEDDDEPEAENKESPAALLLLFALVLTLAFIPTVPVNSRVLAIGAGGPSPKIISEPS